MIIGIYIRENSTLTVLLIQCFDDKLLLDRNRDNALVRQVMTEGMALCEKALEMDQTNIRVIVDVRSILLQHNTRWILIISNISIKSYRNLCQYRS